MNTVVMRAISSQDVQHKLGSTAQGEEVPSQSTSQFNGEETTSSANDSGQHTNPHDFAAKDKVTVVRSLEIDGPSVAPQGSSAGKETLGNHGTTATQQNTGKTTTPSNSTPVRSCKTTNTNTGQKRDAQGAPKRSSTSKESTSKDCGHEEESFTQVLQDLAKAVSNPPPKPDRLELWSDVLVSDMQELPEDKIHEARLTIDGYIIKLQNAAKLHQSLSQVNSSVN